MELLADPKLSRADVTQLTGVHEATLRYWEKLAAESKEKQLGS